MTIKFVRGNPASEELAAALAVIHARACAASPIPAARERSDEWADKERNIPRRTHAQPGPTAWRSAYRPR